MKKIIITFGLWLLVTGLWAQNDTGAKIVPVSQAVQNKGFTIQVGVPYLGDNSVERISNPSFERYTNPLDIRFPWDILYLFPTFTEKEGAFDVSKGFFGDKILINWDLRANFNLISSIKIYRREFREYANNTEDVANKYDFVASVSKSETTYEDKYVEGGVLYEYKVVAEGVNDVESLYNNYITGIGYRNPTAVVTGNISYKGGNPVKDVIVKASSDGSSISEGSSLNVPATSTIKIEELSNLITNATTFQAWVKPENEFTNDSGTPINIFQLANLAPNAIDVKVNLLNTSNKLSVNIGGSKYELHNYYPSGKISSRGDDIMIPVSNFNSSFVHFSVVMENGKVPLLYINGRAITNDYKLQINTANGELLEEDDNYLPLNFELTIPTQTNILNIGGGPTEWNHLYVGGQNDSFIDEIRIWKEALDPTTIRTDYSRYISGNDSRMVTYLSANEKVGSYAYDLSRDGFNYNKNHGELWEPSTDLADKVLWAKGSGNFPTSDQLGILGVTDINGNYEITSIPYSGTGESFNITPLYGVHQFEPGQQLVFLGQGSEVVNKIDFTDISSFSFKGKILYDTRGVFKSFVETTDPDAYIPASKIIGEGYNYYETLSDGKLSKGEYWYNEVTDRYDKYATIYSDDVNVYIDGNIVLNENNLPVVSESKDGVYGYFDIEVPIGNHYISVKKTGHNFKYEGRFPAEPGTFKEFFEDSNEAVIFVDSTRVTLVGKVVGGSVEAAKPIGFGDQGLFQKQITGADGDPETITISALNNIGQAAIKLGYIPPGSTESELETEFNFTTNILTGEYRKSVMPLKYTINQLNGLRIVYNDDNISLLKADEKVNLSKVGELTIPQFEYPDGSFEFGEPYHYEKSFVYRSTPVLRVLNQTSEAEVDVNGEKISTQGFEFLVYNQFGNYEIEMQSFEPYLNYDGDDAVEDIVPIIDGEFKPTNNLALEGSEIVERDANDSSIIIYTFKGGLPSISSPFTRTIDIKYRINDIDYEAEDYDPKGIILGGQSDGSQTFTTAAPDVPDIILRDPPGSNSFAYIESGESITFTTETEFNNTIGESEDLKLMLGVEFKTGGGLAGPVIETETTDNVQAGIELSRTSTDGKSLTKSYSFSQTISTSDDPDYVGSNGDLYIGQSKNYFYGSYDDIQTSKAIIGTSDSYPLTNIAGETIFVSKQKAMYFVEEPSETFFIFSQKHILETLIPGLQLIISNYENGIVSEDDPGIQPLNEYQQQVNLWRKVILDNEKSKYLVKNNRSTYKDGLVSIVNNFNSELTAAINDGDLTPALEANLNKKLTASNNLKSLLETNFDDNISFDAGVGEFTRSIETSIVSSSTKEINLNINERIAAELGFAFNSTGLISTTTGFFEQDINAGISEEQESTVTISYTLKDNDKDNLLSVDVVNLFDGNGPIFSAIGGVTSCPYEGPERSIFYNHADYNPEATVINELIEEKQEELSYATQRAELPLISVEVADVSNVPESNNAEFILLLENNSVSETDVYFELIVDNLSNPSNAVINIEPNGTVVFVPYGQKVEYAMTLGKSISDVYDYEDIKIVLRSRCDEDVFAETLISAHFVPSCSEVELTAPLTNWVYNNKTAYNIDESVNPLQIKLAGFDTSFNSFKKLDLEYRLASSPTWTSLQTYYTNQDFYDEAVAANESEIALIDSPELVYALDIVGLQLSDGEYELRARSTCTNDTEYISEVVTGRVDLTSPQRFGTPLPIDGILGAGEDLKVSFNEPIFYNSAISTIEIKGQTNQLPINHSVSLHFEGESNTAVINKPKITSGDFTLEFWMNNSTVAGTADIIKQDGGLNISLNNGEILFSLGGISAQGSIANDGLYHHYTFTHKNSSGEISIYQDDAEIGGNSGSANVDFTNNNSLVIGGNSFIGNIQELRLWNKTISLENAYAKMYDKLIGNEANLVGYWPMDEGRGEIAKDLARYKHAQINADWDIKPKGTSYEFNNGQYLVLDNVGLVQLTNEMDATISFWMKTPIGQQATLFSNGKGDGSDVVQSNERANKWAINMTSSGMLTFESEGNSYVLTSEPVADDNWHHITLLFNRIGSLRTYVDAEPVTSNQMATIGGFSGNKIWLGARGSMDLAGVETVDNEFTGKIDEFRLWNTLRNVEQISRDRFNEVEVESIGLVLYARMNAPDPENGSGPRYFHADVNETIAASLAGMNSGEVNYSDDVPAIRPERELIKFEVNRVINGDQMILEPVVTDWASLEGQILDITVHRMFDSANNRQQSPITWTAYVKRNEVSWFAEGYNEIVDIVKNTGEEKSFEITLINKGGSGQPYSINNVPSWLKLSSASGTIAPDSKIILKATIDKELTAGEYLENMYLQTDFGFDEKMQVKLRVLAPEPDWEFDPTDFDYSMNIVGRIKVDSKFSEDSYDKIAAFYNGEVRGAASLVYNEAFKEYYVYLTVYSNNVYGENIVFSIWDASQGKTIEAEIDGDLTTTFKENEVEGSLSIPIIFENSDVLVQDIELNKGWTWVSLNVNDSNYSNLNALTQSLKLETDDRMLSHSPSQLETYYKDASVPSNSTWSGTVSANGGLSVSKMYKVKFANEQALNIKGTPIDLSNWSFPIKENWNWLPYPLLGNQSTNEALAYFDAVDGDVIKSQNLFAIYDPINGWNGTLNYLVSGTGYMIKSSKDQTFSYPNYLAKSSAGKPSKFGAENGQPNIASAFMKYSENMNAVVQLPEGFNELFIYDSEGNLKGKSINQIVNDKELNFITIYGEINEPLVFSIGDGRTKKATTKTISFKSNSVLGTVKNPIVLEMFSDQVDVFPNPFENDLTIKINALEAQDVLIQLFSISSQLVYSQEKQVETGTNWLKISPKVASGIYLLQVKVGENILVSKVVKK
ncbi:LamG-like jellyroll fold domain-containing protein [Lutibacter citreus]|uniref:LamG-like jellyroll fold domain-containing protein n=1 Tax=Lutibacter citreus TaxID=2138210 RepID=UPI000DBE9765|nr:LamG-like jellyroll fold domain-containing protein [Lutibacter citreus]